MLASATTLAKSAFSSICVICVVALFSMSVINILPQYWPLSAACSVGKLL